MDVSPGYHAADAERRVTEPDKPSGRSPFQRDRARVLHSAALRRLAAKTQVVVPWESDFPRTRLTHSLECAQVGRELGLALGCDPDLVETGCLAHDLGHPPFGHNGESALAEVAEPCGGFEGNAQSLRILVRLEAKALADDGSSAGLNLTRAALDAATKYPWPRRDGLAKLGVYADDRPAFDWVRADAPGERRCLEAQVMDWADDVAYSVHDLEDAVQAGHLVLDVLHDPGERAALVALTQEQYASGAEPAAIEVALDRLLALPYWPSRFDSSLRALAALKDTTSGLIGRFCRAAEDATRETWAGPLTRYGADLVVPDDVRLECGVLKAITARYVMQREGAPAAYERQREVVHELVDQLLVGAPAALDPVYREWFDRAPDDAARLRAVVDQVASLTDPGALALHGRLTGR